MAHTVFTVSDLVNRHIAYSIPPKLHSLVRREGVFTPELRTTIVAVDKGGVYVEVAANNALPCTVSVTVATRLSTCVGYTTDGVLTCPTRREE